MATAEERKYKVIGTRPIRHDGVDKVTGRAKYGADVKLSGMIYGSILRSPHAHARIVRIDTSQAESLPGVRAVVTGADLPEQGDRVVELGEGAVNMRHLSSNVLAHEKVLYKGHAVAAVAADSPHIAEEALGLIEVEYEPLPAVLDVRGAMQDSAPILNDDVRTQSLGSHPPAEESKPTNIAKHFLFQKGDVEQGFEKADMIVEHEFDTATVHQGYIEPHNATAHWNADGKVTVWMSTQGSFTARQQTAELLRIPVSDVKVIPMEIGGGFGGKISVYLPPVAAALSKKAGRPVKVVMSRANVFEATGPTPGSVMRVKLGATKDGKLVAGDAWLAFEAGAYPGSPIGPGCMCVFACYDIPHARVEGFDVCVNKPRTNAYRAPGSTQVAFATESLIDELARQLDIEPAEFRLKNAAKEGTRRVDGPVFSRIGMAETVEAIRDSAHYQTPLEGKNRGRGMASGFWFNAGLKSTVSATVNLNGTVSLVEGSPDIGGTRTSIAMQLAETLGIRAEDVESQRGRHRYGRLHRRDRRQPGDVLHRHRRRRSREGHPTPNGRTGRFVVGRRSREGPLRRRLDQRSRRKVVHLQRTRRQDSLRPAGRSSAGEHRVPRPKAEPSARIASIWKSIPIRAKCKSFATPSPRTWGPRFIRAMWKAKCKAASCRASAGHSTKNTGTTTAGRCGTRPISITACPPATTSR